MDDEALSSRDAFEVTAIRCAGTRNGWFSLG